MANDGTVKIGTELDDSGFKSGLSKLGGVAKAAVGGITTGLAGATAAVGALAKSSLDAYASYEQLVGGVETLFKDSAGVVQEYAANAYKTAGLSANDYMETVTSFSASLLQGLGGDTAAAAEVANQAITDMSDNANKMGTSMDMIQNAYQGFAKQNYTMLDNLKLGYGGTQAEMARLINDSGVLGDTIEVTAETVNQVSFDKIIEAIHVVQTEMGITGTTAEEASTTIEGSVNSAKAAWTNLITGIADDNANLDELVNNFVESAATAASNILPRIETILGGVGDLIGKLAPIILDAIPDLIDSVLPGLISAAGDLVNSVSEVLPDLVSTLVPVIIQFFSENVSDFVDIGVEILLAIVNGISENIDLIISAIPQIISSITDAISEHGEELKEAGAEILGSIADGLVDIAPILEPVIDAIQYIIENFETFLPIIAGVTAAIAVFKTSMMISSIIEGVSSAFGVLNTVMNANPFVLIATLIIGIVTALVTLWNTNEGFRDAVTSAWEAVKSAAETVCTAIADFFSSAWDSIKNAWSSVKEFFSNVWDGIKSVFSNVKDVLSNFFKSAWEAIKNAWSSVTEFFSNIWDGIKSVFSVVKDVLLEYFQSAWESIKAVWDVVTDFFENIWNTIKGIFSAVESVLKGDFEGAWEAIKGVFSGWGDFFSGLYDMLVNAFSNVWDAFSSIGSNIVSGIKNGISNAWGSLTSWVSDKFNGLVSGVKSFLGIASPSKVFASIGGYMAEGVGVGWDDEFSDIQKDINKSLDFNAAIQRSIPIVRGVASSMVPRGVYGGQNVTNNTNSSMVFNISVSGASSREEARNIGREIGAETQREMRRRGLVMA